MLQFIEQKEKAENLIKEIREKEKNIPSEYDFRSGIREIILNQKEKNNTIDNDIIEEKKSIRKKELYNLSKLKLLLEIYKHNMQHLSMVEFLPKIIEIINKYSYKRIGEKTYSKMQQTIFDNVGLLVTITSTYSQTHISIKDNSILNWNITVTTDKPMYIAEGKNTVLNSFDLSDFIKNADLKLYYMENIIKHPENYMEKIIEKYIELQHKIAILEKEIHTFNDFIKIDCIEYLTLVNSKLHDNLLNDIVKNN